MYYLLVLQLLILAVKCFCSQLLVILANLINCQQQQTLDGSGVAGFTVPLDRRSPWTAYPRKKGPPGPSILG